MIPTTSRARRRAPAVIAALTFALSLHVHAPAAAGDIDGSEATVSSISGMVYRSDGTPAEVQYVNLYKDGVNVRFTHAIQGSYTFDRLEPGSYTVKFNLGMWPNARDEWWNDVHHESQATPIVITSTPRAVTGIDATLETVPDIIGSVFWGPTDQPSIWPLTDTEVVLLREDAAESGEWVEYQSDLTWYNGTFAIENVPPGRYLLKVDAIADKLLRTTYWPGTQNIDEAGVVTVADDRIADITADITMVGRSIDSVDRIEGPDRYSTAVAATGFGFATADVPVPVVYIASGAKYPDALSAGPAAVKQGGALLMVTPDSIPAVVQAELDRLEPERVVIVGSEASVSVSVEADLRAQFGSSRVVRVAGPDRFATSRAIAEDAFRESGATTAFIATGANFPDALAAGPAASVAGAPVILVNGAADDLDADSRLLLERLGVTEVFVLGSALSVSTGLESALAEFTTTIRLEGVDRYQTALAVVAEFFPSSHHAFLATGENFPDALGGGALAGRLGAPLYLTPRSCLSSGVLDDLFYIDARELHLLGSSAALSDDVGIPRICD